MSPTTMGRYAEAWIEAAWLSLAILVPLHFERFSSDIFESHKTGLLLCGAVAIGLGWTIRATEGGRVAAVPPRRSRLTGALLLFVGAAALSTVLSVDPWTAFAGTVFRRQGLLTLLAYVTVFAAILRFARRPAQRERLLGAVILASVPVCLYGLAQRAGVDPVLWEPGSRVRISSTLGNPIFLGSTVTMMMFPTLARLVRCLGHGQGRRPRLRDRATAARAIAYALLLALQGATLLATGSRGPVLGALAGGLAFGICALRMARPPGSRRVVLALSLVAAAAGSVVLLVLASAAGPDAKGASNAAGEVWDGVERAVLRSNTARERLLYWQGYLDTYLSRTPVRLVPAGPEQPPPPDSLRVLRPWIGQGLDVASEVFQQHYPRELFERHGPAATADRAHNGAWDRLIAGGVLGLVVWCWLLVQILQRGLSASGFRMGRTGRERFTRTAVAGAALLGTVTLAWPGPFFFGVAFQAGLAGGILLFLALGPLRAARGAAPLTSWALLAALVAHLVDGTVGFGVTATRLAFWTFAALLTVAATRRSVGREPAAPADPEPPRPPARAREGPGRERRVMAALLLLVAGSVAFDLLGGVPMTADADAIETAPAAELCRIAFARAETARPWWLYGGWSAFLVGGAAILAAGGGAPERAGRRAWLALGIGLPAAALAVVPLGVRPARADILTRGGMRWRTVATPLRVAAGGDAAATLRVAAAVLGEATRVAPHIADYRIKFAESASAAALATPPGGPPPREPAGGSESACALAGADRPELFARSAAALEAARPWSRANPLIPLNLAYVHGRWARATVDPDERARRGREADAWLARAQEMYPPGLPIERWLAKGTP